jgi:hypothetical protein
MAQFTFINFKDSTTMMTTTNTTVFKRMGRILSLVFSDYNEARAFREAFMRLVTYAVLFIIGYRLNLVFDNVPDGRIFDGYCMAAIFCGLSVLSGFMNNMICIGGCLTMLIFMVIKLAVSMAIGIIALPISVAYNLYNIAKAGAALGNCSFLRSK